MTAKITTDHEQEIEQAMVAAHQAGIRVFELTPDVSLVAVAREARDRYDFVSEQDAFVAGFIGARRRARGNTL